MALVRLTSVEVSTFSQRQSQRSSTLFKAMQLIVMTLRSWQHSRPAKTELTSAVFPVPGVPETKRDDLHGLSCWADAMKFVITSRSAALPAMEKEPLHVDLSKARTRAYIGRRATWGIGRAGSVITRQQSASRSRRVFSRWYFSRMRRSDRPPIKMSKCPSQWRGCTAHLFPCQDATAHDRDRRQVPPDQL